MGEYQMACTESLLKPETSQRHGPALLSVISMSSELAGLWHTVGSQPMSVECPAIKNLPNNRLTGHSATRGRLRTHGWKLLGAIVSLNLMKTFPLIIT